VRILLSDDLPLADPGSNLLRVAAGLRRAGHEVCGLIVATDVPDDRTPPPPFAALRRVLLHRDDARADLPFPPPVFCAPDNGAPTFFDLSDTQIIDYRDTLRRHLDADVLTLDPQVIHVQHVWVQGHLAAETGVPYVLTARGPELQAYRRDPRYRRFAEEAIAGAARVMAASPAVLHELRELFPHLDDRGALLPELDDPADGWTPHVTAIYEAVLRDRFGS